ncbi:unnamed protein product [Rhizoctonia solani]|uniref:Sm domain-containing protein n=1 Tax=Rhizoctonia solani TaxID=456999 RepID=A0A8H2Y5R8_9AGAM|nr:unnamed protein product [Rhizoctonia solani]
MDATKHVSDRVQELNSLLAKTLRIAIKDGRSFVGTFACIDREKNIVLASTTWTVYDGRNKACVRQSAGAQLASSQDVKDCDKRREEFRTFACIDREKNIVLASTDEYPPPHSPDGPRFVGLIMVPWQYVVSVELEVVLGQDSDQYT